MWQNQLIHKGYFDIFEQSKNIKNELNNSLIGISFLLLFTSQWYDTYWIQTPFQTIKSIQYIWRYEPKALYYKINELIMRKYTAKIFDMSYIEKFSNISFCCNLHVQKHHCEFLFPVISKTCRYLFNLTIIKIIIKLKK